MLRKSVVILALLLSSLASQVFALGLGSVTVESALNQPLRLRIEILDLGDTRVEDVNVQMASVDDFERFNIDRLGFLSNIRFSIEATPQGNFVVLTSNQLVREPYLSFILETRWPNGRLLSEHTILLDLPVFDDQQADGQVRQPISPVLRQPAGGAPADQPFAEPAAPAVSAPVTPATSTSSVQPVLEPEVIAPAAPADNLIPDPEAEEETAPVEQQAEPAQPTVAPQEPTPELVEQAEEAVEEPAVAVEPGPEEVAEAVEEEIAAADEPETIETDNNDTLSDIALQVRPNSSVTIQQTMLAIQRLNPQAFSDGNINRLRSGETLQVPSLDEIEAISPREAIDEVARQNQQFTDVQPLAAPAPAAPAQDDQPQGQLSVVSGDPDAVDATSGAGQLDDAENAELDRRIAELENQLALRQEEADRARIEREELDSRMAELESQVDAAQEIIRLQDIQLAQLQESLAQAAAEAEAAAAEQAAVAAAQAEIEAETPGSSSGGLVNDVMRVLTGNTMLVAFAIALIILLLVVLLIRRNRASKDEPDELDELAEQEFDVEGEEEFAATADDGLDDELDEIIAKGAESESDEELELDTGVEEDIASQAAVLIEHNQLEQAEELLRSALEDSEHDHDLRLKLLDVLSRRNDLAAFEEHADIIAGVQSPVLDREVDKLRASFDDGDAKADTEDDSFEEGLTEESAEAETGGKPEGKSEGKPEESSSFLDDLGIDLDTFDKEDNFEFSDEMDSSAGAPESAEASEVDLEDEKPEGTIEDTGSTADLEFDTSDMDMTFDLGDGDEKVAEETAAEEPADDETKDEAGGLELDAESEPELPAGGSKGADEQEIDGLDFDSDATATPVAEEESKDADELDVEGLDFDSEGPEAVAEPEETDQEEQAVDENALDFDFNKDEIKPEQEEDTATEESKEEVEAFDFDLDDTVVEKPEEAVGTTAEPDEVEAVSFGEDDKTVSETSAENDDEEDFDFDLDEFDLGDTDDIDGEADDDLVSLEQVEESDEPRVESSEDSDIKIELEDDIDLEAGDDAATELADDDEDLDDLGFLSDEDEVEIESVGDIEEVELLSDDDETATKLELAYAYQKMGDADGAKEILQEVIKEGSDEQVKEAEELLASLDKLAD